MVDERLDRLLQVLVVRCRQALDGDVQACHVSEGTPRFPPNQLERVRVLLLRHQRAPRAVRIRQPHEPEFQRRVDDQVLGPPRHLEHQAGAPLECFEHEVAVADGVQRVGQDPLEPEFARHGVPVDVERVSGEGAAPERRAVDALDDLAEALEFLRESGGVREHPVGPADGLRLLQMCVSWHEDVDFGVGALHRGANELDEVALQRTQLLAEPQPHVGGDLLVAAAARVQLAADVLADDLAEAALVGRVDVLVVVLDDERVGGPFLLDLREALFDGRELVLGQDAVVEVGAREGDGARDVLHVEEAVVRERRVVLLHDGVEALCMAVSWVSILAVGADSSQ